LRESPVTDGERALGPRAALVHDALHGGRLGATLQIRPDSIRGVCDARPGGACLAPDGGASEGLMGVLRLGTGWGARRLG
jgi:hypothetical protein